MTIGSLTINRMDKGNQSLWLWLDIHWKRRWIVFSWRKGRRPYCYASNDATPPASDNDGRWIFGRASGLGD